MPRRTATVDGKPDNIEATKERGKPAGNVACDGGYQEQRAIRNWYDLLLLQCSGTLEMGQLLSTLS